MIKKSDLKALWNLRRKTNQDEITAPAENKICYGDTCVWSTTKKSQGGQMVKNLKKLKGWIEEFEKEENKNA